MKPGFFQNERLAELPPEARLLFIGLWMIADREGRLEDRPKRIKMQVFPADTTDVVPLLDGLEREDLIVRYEVDGERYIWIPSFTKHQKPHPREAASTIPPYQGNTKDIPRHVQGDLNPECGILNPESGQTTGASRPGDPPELEEFKSVYPKRAGSQPWPNALKAIRARLREGHTWTEILSGAERYAKFVRETGKENTELVLQASTFCGPSKRFLEPFQLPEQSAEVDDYYRKIQQVSNGHDT